MKDRRGFTVIELLAAFALTSVIVVFLFEIIFTLKNLYVSSGIKTQLLSKQALMSEKLNLDLHQKTLLVAAKCGDGCLNFVFSDGTSRELNYNREKSTFSYGDYHTKLVEGSQFGNIHIATETVLDVAGDKNDSIVTIKIPVIHKLLAKQDFGINVIYQYDSRNTAISGLFVSDVLDVDKRIYLTGSKDDIAFHGLTYEDPGYFVVSGDGTVTQNDKTVVVTGEVGSEVGKTYKLVYTIYDSNSNVMDEQTRNVTVIDSINSFVYTGNSQTFTVPVNGLYKVEAWGAQGGSRGTYDQGGKGGYTVGSIHLAKNSKLHIYVGGSGSYASQVSSSGGFNGGGASGAGSSGSGGSGGGASDVRLSGTALNNRIIVAGGGGGSGSKNDSSAPTTGGAGGGENGLLGTGTASYNGGSGGPSLGGAKASYATSITVNPTAGVFGTGGIGGTYDNAYGGGGGGGGYYGGGGGVRYGTGGGGSGYCGSLLDCTTYAGDVSFVGPVGAGVETGHSGNGYVKITLIAITS